MSKIISTQQEEQYQWQNKQETQQHIYANCVSHEAKSSNRESVSGVSKYWVEAKEQLAKEQVGYLQSELGGDE
jgi:hypothetical protein